MRSASPSSPAGEGSRTASLIGLVDEYAAGMIELGIRPGDRVLLQLPNRLEFVLAAFALFRFGGIPIMGLPASREADIAALCRLAEPVAYITTDKYGSTEYRSIVESLSHGHPYLKYLITDNGGIEGTIPLETLRKPNPVISWAPAPVYGNGRILLLSGGTTGTPKLSPAAIPTTPITPAPASRALRPQRGQRCIWWFSPSRTTSRCRLRESSGR